MSRVLLILLRVVRPTEQVIDGNMMKPGKLD